MKENTGATSQLNIAEPETQNPEPQPTVPPRREGGQPGNQNARTCGFYSKYAAFERQGVMDEAAQIEGLDAEIMLLRSKIERLEEIDPDNVRLFNELIRGLSLVMARRKLCLPANSVFNKAKKIIGGFGAAVGAAGGVAQIVEVVRK
jgi:hypothetical protein